MLLDMCLESCQQFVLCFCIEVGALHAKVNGGRQYSRDLPQGGLEVSCMLTFCGAESQLKKVQALVKKVAVFQQQKIL